MTVALSTISEMARSRLAPRWARTAATEGQGGGAIIHSRQLCRQIPSFSLHALVSAFAVLLTAASEAQDRPESKPNYRGTGVGQGGTVSS